MVPAHSHKISRVSWYSGSCLPSLPFTYGAFTLSGRSSQDRSVRLGCGFCSPNPGMHALRFGLFPVRSPLLRKSMFLSFPPPTKMFQFRGLAHFRVTGLLPAGLSHSEILGSILVCKSPRLIAAYHVFLRLQEPRHPPYALYYFLTFPISPIVVIGTLSHLLKYVNERRKFSFAVNSTRFEPTPKAVLL